MCNRHTCFLVDRHRSSAEVSPLIRHRLFQTESPEGAGTERSAVTYTALKGDERGHFQMMIWTDEGKKWRK